jgi:hypothetical protein
MISKMTGSRLAPAYHVQNLQLIQACILYQNSFPSIQRAVPGMFDGTETFSFTQSDASCPPIWAFGDGTTSLVVVGGMTLLTQAVNFVVSWNILTVQGGQSGINPYIATMSTFITNVLGAFGFRGATQRIVLGYSLGGSAALAWWMLNGITTGNNPDVVAAYGSPRFVSRYQQAMSSSPNVVRSFGIDDVVPNLPPAAWEAPALHVGLTSGQSQGMNTQVQPCNGLAIDNAGNVQASYTIPMSIPAFQGAFSAWMFGGNAEQSNPHAITTYLARWVTCQNAITPNVPTVPTNQLAGPARQSRRIEAEAERAAIQQAAAVGEANPAALIAATTPQLVLAPRTRFTRYSERGVRYVAYGEQIVAVASNKRSQRKLVREYNAWLKTNPGFMG